MKTRATRIGTFLLLTAVSMAADVPTPQDVRDSLQQGNTVRAVRQAEEALQGVASTDAPELHYLLFKAHVLDLQSQKGKLYQQRVGKARDGMALYQQHLDSMEADLRAQGESLLPLLAALLEEGDDLDRLLVLGLLEEMVATTTDGDTSAVQSAAGRATQDATSACVEQERTMANASVPEYAPRPDGYRQNIYSLLSGLAFLSRSDPAAAAGIAVAALDCRGAVSWILQDRDQLERLRSDLAGPLRRALQHTLRDEVKVDALLLLGRFGVCDDLKMLRKQQDEFLGAVATAAGSARRRLQHRLGCAG